MVYCGRRTIVLVLVCFVLNESASAVEEIEDPEDKLIRKVIKECTESKARLWCFTNKAAIALERSMNLDIPLFSGIKLVRNGEAIKYQHGRSLDGFSRFKRALWNFLETHKLSVDLTKNNLEGRQKGDHWGHDEDGTYYYYEEQGGTIDDSIEEYNPNPNLKGANFPKGIKRVGNKGYVSKPISALATSKGFKDGGYDGDKGDKGGGGGGGGGGKKKHEKKYMQYAFMVLLGIFGLTGPLVMKTLAVIAAKALIASKMALIIVGSVALKKLFEKDYEHSSVKVHTITADHDDEHDRVYNYNQILPYSAYATTYAKPVQ